MWLQAGDRRVRICHTLHLVLGAVDDLVTIINERSSGLEAAAGPMPQPGPAASPMPILALAAADPFGNTPNSHGHQEADDDMLGEDSDDLPDYESS